ncbi:MAG TPA: hypothetical protein VM409_04190, partial [Chloroflexia bacterium]|nr:hypothetical protein [Chloroflexia bacterium]
AKTRWSVQLNPSIPLDLHVDAGASQLTLDLKDLNVRKLGLDVGASSTTVFFPQKAMDTAVNIDAGAAHVKLVVPDGVAARVEVSRSPASSIKIDSERFTKQGDIYQTVGYAQAGHKLNINIDAGAASIEVASK